MPERFLVYLEVGSTQFGSLSIEGRNDGAIPFSNISLARTTWVRDGPFPIVSGALPYVSGPNFAASAAMILSTGARGLEVMFGDHARAPRA